MPSDDFHKFQHVHFLHKLDFGSIPPRFEQLQKKDKFDWLDILAINECISVSMERKSVPIFIEISKV